ncbi:hypothetical protein [Anaerococcus sp.]|uniref:hypothetical protein n=1 Tax=Anaerococcus sp. TaxID=1872515 RepID=UPI002A7634DF|nr:hypothetical protein [Anaerococcus sp.]MDD7305783.1 hypothetical protein [Peptoniphilaceae bacterium]MDY2928287.1 hypothetical protein [Anaerococcus sp.]
MFWKRKKKIKNLSLTGRNKRESISIVVSKKKKLISIVRQDVNQILYDTYRIEDIKGGCA